MSADQLATVLNRARGRDLPVMELIRSAEQLKAAGQQPLAEALYAVWITHNGDNPLIYAVLFNYSVVLSESGNPLAAREALSRAIAINPDFLPPYINLGRAHEQAGEVPQAVAWWNRLVEKLPAVTGANVGLKTTALNQIVRTMEAIGQDDTAEQMLHDSLDLDPAQREVAQHLTAMRLRQCIWPVIQPWERVNRGALMNGMSPLSVAAYTDDPLFQLAVNFHYNQRDIGSPQPDTVPALAKSWPDGRLKVGYLSSDLREHAVGYLMAEVPGLHDRDQIEVYSYYCGPKSDDWLHRHYKETSDHFIDLAGRSDAEAAKEIAEAGIQILVDVNGYTREARIKLLAMRPAPVIVNWLGFPGSMASPYHHYIIADDYVVPPENERFFSEKVMRIPCYQPNNRRRVIADRAPTRAEAGLPDDAIVYCSFNGSQKITRFTFERWIEVLKRVQGSVLWQLGASEPTNQRLREEAEKRGVDPARLVFADKKANPDHLARYPLADLFLDSMPYNAHTTASDALWMGVPVVTWSGRSFTARVCGSLLTAAGLPELIAPSTEGFVDLAAELGNDRARLAAIKARLKAGRDACVLFDTPRLVRSLEARYREMWQDFAAGRLPEPDLANLDIYLEVGREIDHEAAEMQALADYDALWRERLAARHRFRAILPDRRMWRC